MKTVYNIPGIGVPADLSKVGYDEWCYRVYDNNSKGEGTGNDHTKTGKIGEVDYTIYKNADGSFFSLNLYYENGHSEYFMVDPEPLSYSHRFLDELTNIYYYED